jgi:hypothetical protein
MSNTTWKRNTAGLVAAVRDRVQDSLARADRAIESLVREDKPVNFNSVAARAGVTRAYLYSRPELRDRIVRLR